MGRAVKDALASGNPWYVQEQLANLKNPHQMRIIRQRWDFFLEAVEDQKTIRSGEPLKVLDAGCGDGINLAILTTIPGIRLFACDYNPIRTERASRVFADVFISQQDLRCVGLADEVFDLIVCSQVLEHIREDVMVLNDLGRMLRPGGRLVVGVPNEGCLMARVRNHLVEPHIMKTTDHVHFYVEKALLTRFAEAEFFVEQAMAQGFFFPKQSINNFFASRVWGFHLMQFLCRLFPSQAGSRYFRLKKKEKQSSPPFPEAPSR